MNAASGFLNFYLVVVKHVSVCQSMAYKCGIRGGKRKRTGCENLSLQKTSHHSRGREGMGLWILRTTHIDCCRAQSPLGDMTVKQIASPQERPNSS